MDLTRAVVAASLVGVFPGWFWAGCLCVTADRAERITYSVALSMALVPVAALVPVRLLDTGVTLGAGFHTLTAIVSRLSGLDPLEIFAVLGPALLLLPALVCYSLACRLWG